jgi:hypothetical protein
LQKSLKYIYYWKWALSFSILSWVVSYKRYLKLFWTIIMVINFDTRSDTRRGLAWLSNVQFLGENCTSDLFCHTAGQDAKPTLMNIVGVSARSCKALTGFCQRVRLMSFSISYWDLIKFPHFCRYHWNRGWKQAQRQGENRVTLQITLITRSFLLKWVQNPLSSP